MEEHGENLEYPTADVISMDIEEGSEEHGLLMDATVDMFVEEGRKLIHKINDMPLDIKDMPENFEIARKLRAIYVNARYKKGNKFCTLYLDKIMDEGLFTCLVKSSRKLQDKWPNLFSETSDPEEVRL